MKKLKHSLYNLSTDYDILWDLIHKGHRIAGYKSYGEVWDIVEIKVSEHSKEVYISVRGNGSCFDDYESFKTYCESVSLHFIISSTVDMNIINEAAEKWVFETNSNKWSNNNNEAGDNYGSFIAGVLWLLNNK